MEVKKNPKADLGRRSLLFFQLGMIVMLFVTWQALEWKTLDRGNYDSGLLDIGDEIEEVIAHLIGILTRGVFCGLVDAFSAYLRSTDMVPNLIEFVAYLEQLRVTDYLTYQEGGAASHHPSNEKGWFHLA